MRMARAGAYLFGSKVGRRRCCHLTLDIGSSLYEIAERALSLLAMIYTEVMIAWNIAYLYKCEL